MLLWSWSPTTKLLRYCCARLCGMVRIGLQAAELWYGESVHGGDKNVVFSQVWKQIIMSKEAYMD